jgi:hypothetical protein
LREKSRSGRKFASGLATAAGWRDVREGIKVKLARFPETGETVILCHSAGRRSEAALSHS